MAKAKGARSHDRRVPSDGYLKQRSENRYSNVFGRSRSFSTGLFSRGPNPNLRSDLAARQGFWRQVCSVRCSPKLSVQPGRGLRSAPVTPD
jgi:hypothetical protein